MIECLYQKVGFTGSPAWDSIRRIKSVRYALTSPGCDTAAPADIWRLTRRKPTWPLAAREQPALTIALPNRVFGSLGLASVAERRIA